MADHRVLWFGETSVEVGPGGTTVRLPSGAVVRGEPHDTPEYRATAAAHGYGDDVAALNREHEAGHCALAWLLGLPCSPVLAHVAGLGDADPVRHALEEDAVLAVQRFARAYGVDLIAVWALGPRI